MIEASEDVRLFFFNTWKMQVYNIKQIYIWAIVQGLHLW